MIFVCGKTQDIEPASTNFLGLTLPIAGTWGDNRSFMGWVGPSVKVGTAIVMDVIAKAGSIKTIRRMPTVRVVMM